MLNKWKKMHTEIDTKMFEWKDLKKNTNILGKILTQLNKLNR